MNIKVYDLDDLLIMSELTHNTQRYIAGAGLITQIDFHYHSICVDVQLIERRI